MFFLFIDKKAFWNPQKAHVAICLSALHNSLLNPPSYNASKGKRNRWRLAKRQRVISRGPTACLCTKVWVTLRPFRCLYLWLQIKVGQWRRESPLPRDLSWATPSVCKQQVCALHLYMTLYLFQHDCKRIHAYLPTQDGEVETICPPLSLSLLGASDEYS